MSESHIVRVSRKGAERVRSGHPWIYSSDILSEKNGTLPAGVVRAVDERGKLLGTAHHSPASQIRLRLLSRQAVRVDREFWHTALGRSIEYRRRVVSDTEAYRLAYSEGDDLPGLIVDRYGDYLVAQFLTAGMDAAAEEITEVLQALLAPAGILARNDAAVRTKEGLERYVRVLRGNIPDRVPVTMNGLRWQVDLQGGQKTGTFLDQRENYRAIRTRAQSAGWQTCLDCFTGTGGFALHLAQVCSHLEAVDSSAQAIGVAEANAAENRLTNISFERADVLELLPAIASARRRFDAVIVDPPAFAKSRGALEGAGRGYKEVNLRALRLLDSGGTLVSCSCSHHFTEADLLETLAAAALDTGKRLRVLERRTQSADHPILLTVPETHYLKCIICEVI